MKVSIIVLVLFAAALVAASAPKSCGPIKRGALPVWDHESKCFVGFNDTRTSEERERMHVDLLPMNAYTQRRVADLRDVFEVSEDKDWFRATEGVLAEHFPSARIVMLPFDGTTDKYVPDDIKDDEVVFLKRDQWLHMGVGRTLRRRGKSVEHSVVVNRLASLEALYPDIVRSMQVGVDSSGAISPAVRICDASAGVIPCEQRMRWFLVGGTHGNEHSGIFFPVVWAERLLRMRADTVVKALLARVEIFVIPEANPGGLVAGTRETASGDDLNRIWPDRCGGAHGLDPSMAWTGGTTTTERTMMQNFFELHEPHAAIFFHTGTFGVGYPNNANCDSAYENIRKAPAPCEDAAGLKRIAQVFLDNANHYSHSVGNFHRKDVPTEESQIYQTFGSMGGWLYGQGDGMSAEFLVELGYMRQTSQKFVENVILQDFFVSLIKMMAEGSRGLFLTVKSASDNGPLRASVQITSVNGVATDLAKPNDGGKRVWTRSDTGSVARFLEPGIAFGITISASGHTGQTINVNVGPNDGMVVQIITLPVSP